MCEVCLVAFVVLIVTVIVTKTFMRDGSAEEIVKALCRRLEKGNWTVRH